MPEDDYEAREGLWLGIKGFSIRVKPTDEGVSVTIYKRGDEMSDSIAETYAYDSEVKSDHEHILYNADVMQTVCTVCGVEMDLRPGITVDKSE